MSAAPETESGEVDRPTKLGQYAVVRRLARGGMSEVYEGRHPQLGGRVALKVMHPALAAQPMAAARFLREAKAASQIRHQNVVEVYDVGVENGVPFLVMEFLDGADLATLLAEKGAMPLAGLVEVFLPVMSAVATAHRAGIIHRDLKPSNLMLTKRAPRGSCAMVLDFGISKMIGEELENTLTKSESLLGTVQYMAPELTKGAKYASPASDQYALGVMLYECATGQRPFTGEGHYDLMHAIVTAPVKAPSEIVESLPPEFDEVVLRAMSRDSAHRFPSIEALGSALLSFGDKSAWALWEDEFLGTSEGGREPWSAGPTTINDGVVAPAAPRRAARKRASKWTKWALAALAVYGAVVTALLGRRSAIRRDKTEEGPRAGEPPAATSTASPPAPANVATPQVATVNAPSQVPTLLSPAPASSSAALAERASDTRAGGRRKSAKDRAAAAIVVAPAPAPVESASPRPASTVGTNGAPIVE